MRGSRWAVVFGLAIGCAPGAETGAPDATADPIAIGRTSYVAYCAKCHGPAARGDGPAAASLDPAPADLTRIAERAGGAFDRERVAAFVDGREWLQGQGPSEMPVWGRELDDRNAHLAEETRLGPPTLYRIVDYLETLQRQEP